jgi:hypothetical protein
MLADSVVAVEIRDQNAAEWEIFENTLFCVFTQLSLKPTPYAAEPVIRIRDRFNECRENLFDARAQFCQNRRPRKPWTHRHSRDRCSHLFALSGNYKMKP